METLVGYVTADAKLATLKDDRKVTNFSIAVNDSYKPKGGSEVKKITRFFNCAFWLGPEMAKYLTKGTLVELAGRIDADPYINKKGEAKASLKMHVNDIKLHGKSKGGKAIGETATTPVQPATERTDDLPF